MSHLSAKLKEELHALLPPVLFFFVALHVVALIRALMVKGTGIAIGTSASVTLAALVLGKAVLVADLLPFINRYPHKPLIYNILWKTGIYVCLALIVHWLERAVELWPGAGGFLAANRQLLAEIVWPHFWAIQLLLLVLIAMYCTMRELIRVVGPNRVRRMFFGPLDRAPAA